MITAAEREQLLRKAQIVANETETAANDANRIGTLFALIVRALGDGATEEDIKDLIRNFGSGLFLSKLNEDTASAVITFLQGLKIGNWQEGDLIGSGGYIDPDANATLNSLRLREWLEVPELRYNRVEIFLGTQWHSFGGGIIATVDGNGTSGSATLKLEDGEVGAVAADDLCMGIWHDTSGNATTDSDDRQGRFSFRGFKTVYFRITSVPATDAEGADNSDRHYFEYALRSIAEGGNGFHPFAGMHFSGRGNPTDTNRQAFQYSTLEYSLRLKGVTTWEFQPSNIVNIEGKLDGFSMPARRRNPITGQEETYLKPFSGYGQVFGNAYMFGTIDQFERVADVLEIVQSTDGRLVPGETGTVRVMDAAPILDNLERGGVDEDTRDNLEKALANLDYKVLKVELKRGKDAEDSSLGFKLEGTATHGNTTVPVNLDVTFHGDLDQLINTGMKLRRKTR